jgi:hypothetical protein
MSVHRELPTVAQVKSTRDMFTPAQQYAARELQTIFATRPVLTFVCTKVRWRSAMEIASLTAFVLAVDHCGIVNVSDHVGVLIGLPLDSSCSWPALRLGKRSPQDVGRDLGVLLYLDEDRVKVEVIS